MHPQKKIYKRERERETKPLAHPNQNQPSPNNRQLTSPNNPYPTLPSIPVPVRILYKARQYLTPRLQEWMPGNNLQKPLQPFPAMLDDVVTEPIRKHLPGQWRNSDPRALTLEDIAEVFEVGVAAAHDGVLQFEGGDIGAADDLVRGVHVPGCAMRLGVSDLNFEEVLWWTVYFIEGLLSRLWDGLHCVGDIV